MVMLRMCIIKDIAVVVPVSYVIIQGTKWYIKFVLKSNDTKDEE